MKIALDKIKPPVFNSRTDDGIVDVLWDSSLESGHDEETGDVSGPSGMWFALFRFKAGEEVRGWPVGTNVGAILTVDDLGFKGADLFTDATSLDRAWARIERSVSRFEDGA